MSPIGPGPHQGLTGDYRLTIGNMPVESHQSRTSHLGRMPEASVRRTTSVIGAW